MQGNPGTSFTPERAYKWMQGVSNPRDQSVADDLAQALELEQGGTFFANANLDTFASVLGARFPYVKENLRHAGSELLPSQSAMDAPGTSGKHDWPDYVFGRYIALSPAWAPAMQGRLIFGSIEITDSDGRYWLNYSETINGRLSSYRGSVYRTGRLIFSMALSEEEEVPLFFSLHAPSSPGLAMTGLLSGAALHDVSTRPTASWLQVFRAGNAAFEAVKQRDCYVDATAEAISDALCDLGISREAADGLSIQTMTHRDAHGPDKIEVSLSVQEALTAQMYAFQNQQRRPK